MRYTENIESGKQPAYKACPVSDVFGVADHDDNDPAHSLQIPGKWHRFWYANQTREAVHISAALFAGLAVSIVLSNLFNLILYLLDRDHCDKLLGDWYFVAGDDLITDGVGVGMQIVVYWLFYRRINYFKEGTKWMARHFESVNANPLLCGCLDTTAVPDWFKGFVHVIPSFLIGIGVSIVLSKLLAGFLEDECQSFCGDWVVADGDDVVTYIAGNVCSLGWFLFFAKWVPQCRAHVSWDEAYGEVRFSLVKNEGKKSEPEGSSDVPYQLMV